MPTNVQRILYIRTDRMGDVLMNLPALLALRQNYPKAWLTLAVDRSVAALFKDQPELDEVMELDAAELARNGRARSALIRKIRGIHYDLVIISNPSKFFHWLSFAAGIPVRVGWRRKWGFLLNRALPDKKSEAAEHEIDSNLKLVSLVGEKKWGGLLRLGVNEEAAKEMKKRLDGASAAGGIVAVHTGTSDPAKRWPKEKFAAFCRMIQRRGKETVAFIGGGEEAALAAEISSKLERPTLDLCGKTSLKELAAFFADARVRALVSSDSGPVHVAWMSGKPVVVFYAKGTPGSNPQRWGPRGGRSQTIFKPIADITPEEAFASLEKTLS